MSSSQNTFSIYSDEELLAKICSGEVLAFDEIYHRYSKRLFIYFTRMLNFNTSLAEDALQDVFLKLAENPQSFDKNKSFKTWIFSIASNACKNYYRHAEVVKRSESELIHQHKQFELSNEINSSQRLDKLAFDKMLQTVLQELPPEKREVFILKYQEEKSMAEIAEIQNCPEGSVKSRLHYTLKILEEKLKLFNPIHY